VNPVKHPSNNVMVRPPANWDDRGGQLRLPALHATKGKIGNVPVMVTYWEPTREELAMLLAGGKLQLTCLGGQPACNVSILPPNEVQSSNILLPH
jgi:hypothetical protein